MKKKFNEKIRLVSVIVVCILFIAVVFSSAVGKLSSDQHNAIKEIEQSEITPTQPKPNPLPLFNFRILNRDWDYWSNPPNLLSIGGGKVGIGTINPETLLQVHSNLISSYGVTPIIRISDNIKSWNLGLGNMDDNGFINDRFSIASEDSKERFVIQKTNGNIGIGTTGPATKLHIADDSPIIRFEETDQNNKMWNIGGYNSGIVFSEPGIADRMFIAQGGNVGIGTKNPAYKLDVDGYIQAYGYYTGDIIFQKNDMQLWRMFEDENGLYLQSIQTGKTYKFVLEETNITQPDFSKAIQNLWEENQILKQRLDAIEQVLGSK